MTWEHGRQLSTLTKDGGSISYTYNADGIRTSKTVNGQTTEYILDGSTILGEKLPDGEYLYYLYDENGVRYGFARGSLLYYYVCNAQGDVVKILTSGGATAAWYEYDAWGNVVSIGGNAYVANLNPIRYRGYYYDTETDFYYLNSRYYDPETCRFINADDVVSTVATPEAPHWDKNLFAYCDNNPTVRADDEGDFWHIIVGAVAGALINGAVKAVTNLVEGKSLTDGLGTAMLSGAASGALASTGFGVGVMIAGNAAISMAENATNQFIQNGGFKNFDVGDMVLDGVIGGISGAVGGPGKGSKHLTKLGGQVLNRTTSTASHQGFKAATKELSKASKYYIKNSWNLFYKPLFKGLGRDTVQSFVVSMAASDGMKSLYKEVMFY